MFRSILCVPADDQRKLARARSLGADAILFDLEDGCAPENRDAAFAQLVPSLLPGDHVRLPNDPSWLARAAFLPSSTTLWVPKFDAGTFLPPCVTERGAVVIALLETPAAISEAPLVLAMRRPYLAAVAFGAMDFSGSMGVPLESPVLTFARCQVVTAAAAAGLVAVDSPCFDLSPGRNAAESAAARAIGFAAKGCIHPSQLAEVNEAFSARRRAVRSSSGRPVFLDGTRVVGPSLVGAPA